MKAALICSALLFSLPAHAIRPLSEEAEISILTCSPGEIIYELFGHSALRVCDPPHGLDIVFNYGYFDFYSDGFVLNFVTGQTDYTIGVASFVDFCTEYAARGSSVTECRLNLSEIEKQRMWLYLNINLLPENMVYRYNFVFENCATKIRDALSASTRDSIAYAEPFDEPITYREAIKLYTHTAEWSQFGFDLCLGRGADSLADAYHLTFLPEIMDRIYATSNFVSKDSAAVVRPISASHAEIIPKSKTFEAAALSPNMVFWTLLALALVLCVLQCLRGWRLPWLDGALFAINALFGCVIFFLMFFSEHPFTGENLNIAWLNPLFIVTPFAWLAGRKFRLAYFSCVAIAIAAAMIASIFFGQALNPAFYPLMSIFLTRAIANVVVESKIY